MAQKKAKPKETQTVTVEVSPNGSEPVYEFIVPGPDEPGFLKRMRAGLRFQWLIENNFQDVDFRDLDELTDFLAQYFKGVSFDEAKEILTEASENDFMAMLEAILGQNAETAQDEGSIPKESNPPPADG